MDYWGGVQPVEVGRTGFDPNNHGPPTGAWMARTARWPA